MPFFLFVEIFISLSIFSLVATTIKVIEADPFTIGIFRLAIASVGMLGFVFLKHSWGEFKTHTLQSWKGLSWIGIAFFGHWLTYFFAIKWSTASLGILTLSTYGVILGVLGALLRNEPFHQKDFFAGLCCLFGVYFLIPDFNFQNEHTLGIFVGLLSAVCYAFVPMAHKKVNHVPLRIRIFYQFFVAFIGFLFTFPWSHWSLSRKDWGGLIFLAVGATLIAHSLWSSVSSRLHGKTAGLIYFSYIPFSVLFAHLFLGDELGVKNLLGALLIFSGLLLSILLPQRKYF